MSKLLRGMMENLFGLFPRIHCVLNEKWHTLKGRYQWYNILQSLWNPFIEPKKACLTWLITYRAIWTNKKALKIHKGNGQCVRCSQEEDDLHIFFFCTDISPVIHRIQQWIQSEGRAQWTFRSLLIGESIGCSSGLWAMLRVEILWWLWLKRLNAMYGNLYQDFNNLKESLIKVGEEYYIRTLERLEKNIESLGGRF